MDSKRGFLLRGGASALCQRCGMIDRSKRLKDLALGGVGTWEVLGLRSPRIPLSVCVASVPVPLSSRAAAEVTSHRAGVQGPSISLSLSLSWDPPPVQNYPKGASWAEVGDLRLCSCGGTRKVVIHGPQPRTAGGAQASVSPPVLVAFGVPSVPGVGGCLSVRPSALTFLSLSPSLSLSISLTRSLSCFLLLSCSSCHSLPPFCASPRPCHVHSSLLSSSLPVHPGQSMVERGLGLPLVKTFVLRWVRACAARHPHAVPGACALPPARLVRPPGLPAQGRHVLAHGKGRLAGSTQGRSPHPFLPRHTHPRLGFHSQKSTKKLNNEVCSDPRSAILHPASSSTVLSPGKQE